MATPHILACLLCASLSGRLVLLSPGVPAHQPLAPSSAPDGQRRAKPARFRSILPGTSLLMCNPARSDSHQHGRCGYRRFTRSNWPPVPRSGVAPLRSPQSLPRPRHPVKGHQRKSRLCPGLGQSPCPRIHRALQRMPDRLSRNQTRLPRDTHYVKYVGWVWNRIVPWIWSMSCITTLRSPCRFPWN